MRALTLTIALIALAGCASQGELQQLSNTSTSIARMQMQAVKHHPETITIDCRLGCGKAVVSYTDPRDIPKVTGMRVRGTNDAIVETMPNVVKGVGYVAGAIAATRIVDDLVGGMGGGNVTTHNTSTLNGNNNTQTGTTDVSVSKSSADNNSTRTSADGNSTSSEDNDTTTTTTSTDTATNTTTSTNTTTTNTDDHTNTATTTTTDSHDVTQ